jgi:hypothetical protein
MESDMTDLLPGPTGLDYLAAFEALYPGLHEQGIKVHQLPDDRLKLVDRAARMRRRERERVQGPIELLASQLEEEGVDFAIPSRIRQTLKEIR